MTTTKLNFAIGATLALGIAATSWSSLRQEPGYNLRLEAQPAATDSGRDADFYVAAAGLDGQLQTLRRLEKEMLRSSASEDKLKTLRQRWDESRSRAERLVANARGAAHTQEQRVRVEQLAALTLQADTRIQQPAFQYKGGSQ